MRIRQRVPGPRSPLLACPGTPCAVRILRRGCGPTRRLTEDLLQQLVEALQRSLNLQLSVSSGSIRKSDSVSSNLSVAGSEMQPPSVYSARMGSDRLPSLTGTEGMASPATRARLLEGLQAGHHERVNSFVSQIASSDAMLDQASTVGTSLDEPHLTHRQSAGGVSVDLPPPSPAGTAGILPPPPPPPPFSERPPTGAKRALAVEVPSEAGTEGASSQGVGSRQSSGHSTREEDCIEMVAQQTVDSIMNGPVRFIQRFRTCSHEPNSAAGSTYQC